MKINPFEMNEHEGTNFYHEHLQSDVDEGYPEIIQLDDCKYIFADEFKDRNNHLKTKNESFSLLHVNARSLSHNFDELCSLLSSLDHQFTCIGISETWFNSKTMVQMFNPKTAGGGLNQPPPRHFARPFRRANFFDRAARWLFTFKSRASYDTIFAKIGHTVTMLHNLLYMLVRPKMAQKHDFVYKVNVNVVFSPYS